VRNIPHVSSTFSLHISQIDFKRHDGDSRKHWQLIAHNSSNVLVCSWGTLILTLKSF